MNKKKLVYLISHGHTARGLLQTDLLALLGNIADVYVVCKKESGQSLKLEVENQGGTLKLYDSKHSRNDNYIFLLRSFVHQNIRQNPALWEKHLRRTKSASASWKRKLFNRILFLIGNTMRVIPGGKLLFSKAEKAFYFRNEALNMLSSINPDAVISTRPVDDMEIHFLTAAKKLRISSLFYILSWDNITSKGIFPVLGDYFLTWGPITNEELKKYYEVENHKLYNTGVTHFDIHAAIRDGKINSPKNILSSMGLHDQNPYLFFTMSASYYAPNEIDIIETLAKKVSQNVYGEEMQMVIRPHMVNLISDRSDQSWLKRLKNLESNRVKVDFPDAENSLLTWYMKQDDMIRLSQLINGAAVCLNSGSTIAIEAVYLDKPVVLTPFDTEEWPYWRSARRLMDYLHLKKFVATGACSVAENLDEMCDAIQNYLDSPELHQEERKKAVDLECYRNDGKATERFVNNIQEILEII